MGKALIIAEKPSVAADIARALGGFAKKDDSYENDKSIVSSAIGHLLELAAPAEAEVKRGKWSFSHLPVIPSHFDLKPIEKTESRLKLLARLMKRKDVDLLINACDAGREGELIFRYLARYVRTDKPIRRLWLQSMTPAAIRDGFRALRDDLAMRPLADAATCRSESDWLVGINGTRAMTAFNSKSGGFQLTTVGRVQTPTLAIVAEREEKIKKFTPRAYWEVCAVFRAAAGTYEGRWFDENFSKEKKEADPDLKPERLWSAERAEAIRQKCAGQPGVAAEETKPSTQAAPLLYDLTTLQREAHGRFGFSAKRTLQLAQALYERHKTLTYPRTDSRALPEDYLAPAEQIMQALAGVPSYGAFAAEALRQNWIKPNKRIFNNAKVSDHFAITPTSLLPKSLSPEEQKIYDMVTRRFLAIFYPAAEFLLTTRITRVLAEPFKTEGKVLVQPGWLAVYGRELEPEAAPNLTPIQPGETVQTEQVTVEALQTKPPPRFTEATLLSAMEGAGKLIEDEELRQAMSAKGLGTPATRAAIIEGLIEEKYIIRTGRELQATPKGMSLIALLRGLGIPELTSPELTGDWEFKLKQIERGELKRSDFMAEIADMTRSIVDKARRHESDTVPGDFGPLKTPCPKCGGEIKETYKKFQCQQCGFGFWKIAGGRQIEPAEAEELIAQKKIGPLQGFRSRAGKPFAAVLKLNEEGKVEFDFGQSEAGADGVEIDFSGQEPVGRCPKCGHRVFEGEMYYVCEKAVGPNRTCDFRSGKIILQRPIERSQMAKLLETGRTDLLPRFISKKGRPFAAFLVTTPEKRIGFEFAPRAPKKAKAKSPAEAQR